jgi:metal-responsive CopG/Arc/MetJ family transcriptional regulator
MRVRTSITLPPDVIEQIDELAGDRGRSQFIEFAVRSFVRHRARKLRDARDREILDAHADQLNAEAEDALSYQIEP